MYADPTVSASAPVPPRDDERLLRALRVAAGITEGDGALLRDAVFDYVAQAKRRLLPPQEVLIELKAHARRAVGKTLEQSQYNALVASVVQWAIEEYYRGR
jgi:hypothetical protein